MKVRDRATLRVRRGVRRRGARRARRQRPRGRGSPAAASAPSPGACRRWRRRCTASRPPTEASRPRRNWRARAPRRRRTMHSRSSCCSAPCCARCTGRGVRSAVAMIMGQPIDRIDGRLKVTGGGEIRGRIPGADRRPRRTGAEHDRRGHDHRVRTGRRRACPACSPSSRRTTRMPIRRSSQGAAGRRGARCCRTHESCTTASTSPSSSRTRLSGRRPRRPRVKLRYEEGEPQTDMQARWTRPTRRRTSATASAARQQPRRPRRRFDRPPPRSTRPTPPRRAP